jgi:hypothetical protein
MSTTIKINLHVNSYYSGTKVLDGNTYRLRIHWNTHTQKWYMDLIGISNSVDIKGIALLPGKDLLRRYGYLELGQLWMIDNSNAGDNPNYDDIGGRFELQYITVHNA